MVSAHQENRGMLHYQPEKVADVHAAYFHMSPEVTIQKSAMMELNGVDTAYLISFKISMMPDGIVFKLIVFLFWLKRETMHTTDKHVYPSTRIYHHYF